MKYLLDTCVLIYLGCDDLEKIGSKALKTFQNLKNKVYISQMSYWEIAIKVNIGKLSIPIGLKNLISLTQQSGIEQIPIKNIHITNYQNLPRREDHKDPFDRFLISVLMSEKLKIITNDIKFDLYPEISRIW